jgi:hypothetical protein
MKCGNCKLEIPDGCQYCPNCGTKVETIINRKCIVCGLENLPEDAMYCPRCGSNLKESDELTEKKKLETIEREKEEKRKKQEEERKKREEGEKNKPTSSDNKMSTTEKVIITIILVGFCITWICIENKSGIAACAAGAYFTNKIWNK